MGTKTNPIMLQAHLDAATRSIASSRVVVRVVERYFARRAAGVFDGEPLVQKIDFAEAEDDTVFDFLREVGRLDLVTQAAQHKDEN